MASLSLLNDLLFKIVFGQEQSSEPLRSLINALLALEGPERIVELEILNPYGSKQHLLDKDVILDVKARDGRKRLFNVEVQMAPQPAYVERALYYLARLFSSQLVPGVSYTQLTRTIGISLLDFELFPEAEALHSRFRLHDQQHGRELTDVFELHFIELAKFRREAPEDLRTPFERWLNLLRYSELYGSGERPVPEVLIQEEGIEMALNSMRRASASAEVRELIEMWEKAGHDVATRIEAAEQKGRQEERLQTARRMREAGMATEQILQFTGLSAEDLQAFSPPGDVKRR